MGVDKFHGTISFVDRRLQEHPTLPNMNAVAESVCGNPHSIGNLGKHDRRMQTRAGCNGHFR